MPRVIVLAGINGAGKTTASAEVLGAEGLVDSFVNADAIARGLNGLSPESVAMQAGQVMLERINKLVAAGENFAIETTLAGRTYFAWLRNAKANHGYQVLMYYYWLRHPDMAVERVAMRVRSGGHHIPEATIRQRYQRSISNFVKLYKPLCDHWEVFDNSNGTRILLAKGNLHDEDILIPDQWERFLQGAEDRRS